MKVVLQNKKTHSFFGEGNKWVTDINEAISFNDSITAESRCREIKLPDTQIIIRTEIGHNIVLSCCQRGCP